MKGPRGRLEGWTIKVGEDLIQLGRLAKHDYPTEDIDKVEAYLKERLAEAIDKLRGGPEIFKLEEA